MPPIVVRGRHTTVAERFRQHVHEKLAAVVKLDHKIIRLDVEVSAEHNPRQSPVCERVEITCIGRGPVVRAEAAAQDAYAALDVAVAKLEERLRRAANRRHSRGARLARLPQQPVPVDVGAPAPAAAPAAEDGVVEGDVDGPFVVREKVHVAEPMSIDDALANMELVGHDFYLFRDVACGTPSVVYRRRGYHYGVLRLGTPPAGTSATIPD
ncbi:MAG TPA: ribosome-associated translation inhibitor RaiA [Mycobacteriales bacterium]